MAKNKKISMSFAKLVENLTKLVAFMLNFDARYNPTNALITLAAMQAFLNDVTAFIDNVGVKLGIYKEAVDDRETGYKRMDPLTRRTLRAFKSSGVNANQIADAETYTRKIQGKRKTPAVKDDPNTPEDESAASHSASQMAYSERLQTFQDFTAYLKAAGFTPNENELHPDKGLKDYADELVVLNTAVDSAFVPLSSERGSRNTLLLDDATGIIPRANAVKNYVYSVYEPDSTEYKQIKSLRFN